MKKLFLLSLGLLFSIIVLVFVHIVIGGIDIEEPDLSDLALPEITLSDEDNALTYFKKAQEFITLPSSEDSNYDDYRDYLRGDNFDHQKARAILESENHTKALELIKQGIACQQMHVPITPDTEFTYALNVIGVLHDVMSLLTLKVRYLGNTQNFTEATTVLQAYHDLAQLSQKYVPTFTGYLIGCASFQQSYNLGRFLAFQPDISVHELRSIYQTFSTTPENNLPLAIKTEHHSSTLMLLYFHPAQISKKREKETW